MLTWIDLVRERKEYRVFTKLLQIIPGLEERLMRSSEEEVVFIAELVCCRPPHFSKTDQLLRYRKAHPVRGRTTPKALKGAILDWITPRGQPLNPSLSRNVKIDRGFHHERTGALLCPVGLDWSNNE